MTAPARRVTANVSLPAHAHAAMSARDAVLRGDVAAAVDRLPDLDDDERTLLVDAAFGVPRAALARGINENTFEGRIRRLCRKTSAPNLDTLVIRALRLALTLR